MTISFDHLPVEPTVTLIDPDGKDLITTNNPIAILHARVEIKLNKLTGYKIRTASGFTCEIDDYGRFSEWPQGEIPGDIAESIYVTFYNEFIKNDGMAFSSLHNKEK